MAKKTTSATSTPKTRKPRTAVEKVFFVATSPPRLVAGLSQRKVEAAVWQKPAVRVATPTDLRELVRAGVQIETIESPQARIDAPTASSDGTSETAGDAAAA